MMDPSQMTTGRWRHTEFFSRYRLYNELHSWLQWFIFVTMIQRPAMNHIPSYSISLFSFAAWGLNHCTWKTLADHKCKLSFFNVFQVEKKDLETIDRELAWCATKSYKINKQVHIRLVAARLTVDPAGSFHGWPRGPWSPEDQQALESKPRLIWVNLILGQTDLGENVGVTWYNVV